VLLVVISAVMAGCTSSMLRHERLLWVMHVGIPVARSRVGRGQWV
jgi:hypothetical protein